MWRSTSNPGSLPRLRRTACAVLLTLACAGTPAFGQNPPPPQPQDGFVPVGNNPVQQEQLPAAPLLIAAYIVVLGGLFVYVVSLARRLTAVQRDVDRLEADLKRRGGSRT